VAEAARLTGRLVDRLSHFSEAVRDGLTLSDRTRDKSTAALSSLRSGWLRAADRTPLNPDIGPNRRFDWTDIPLEGVKALKNKLAGSVNDVVLAITAGAVRRFLIEERDYDVSGAEFRVMNPVSTRSADQRGALGNQVAMWLLELPIQEPDPRARFDQVKKATTNLKKTNQALGAATLVEISSGTPITLLSIANRVVGPRIRPFNMTVTNIPGPQFPMYLLESEMLANYPMVPLWSQHGIGIALFSYNGRLLWGIHADYDTLPDSDRFLTAIQESFRELQDLPG
jgi:WS/DGAT/MGAT family acyltransferase